MGQISLLDFVISLLQVLSLAFLVYGAYLATRRAGVRPSLSEPLAAAAEKQRVLADTVEPRRERRVRARRRTDRRADPRENLYGLAR